MAEQPKSFENFEDEQKDIVMFYNVDDETLNSISLDNKEIVDILTDTLLSHVTGFPKRLSKIKDMKYDFSPLRPIDDSDNKAYETYIDCADIDGFLYPRSIFTGKIDYSMSNQCISFMLKDEYRNISDTYGHIDTYPKEYFSHGKVPSFDDFVVRKRIVISSDKMLKVVIANCQGHKFITDGVGVESIVDFDEKMMENVSIEVYDKSIGRDFAFHKTTINFDESRIYFVKRYFVKDNGAKFSLPTDYDFSFSIDISMLHDIIPFSNEYPMDNLSPLAVSKNFCKMFSVDWRGIELRKYKEKEQLKEININKDSGKAEFEYQMYIDNGDDKAKWRSMVRFDSNDLKLYSPLNDGGGAFLNKLMLLRQTKKSLIGILSKYGIEYKDEKVKKNLG